MPSHRDGRPSLLRRRYIVDRRMQVDLALRAGLAVGALLVAMGFALFLPMARKLESTADPLARNDVGSALLYLHANYWPLVLASAALAFAGTVLLSHRIAGPLVRVRRAFRSIADGTLPPPMTLRRRDHLVAEVELLNEMVEQLAVRSSGTRRAERELRAALDAAPAGDDLAVRAAFERLSAAIAVLPRRADEVPSGPQSATTSEDADSDTAATVVARATTSAGQA